MLPILQIGPLALQTPGLLLLLGVWLGLSLSERLAQRFQTNANQLYTLVLVGLAAGLIGSRLAYAAQFFSIFWAAPLTLFTLTPTMLNSSAGVVIGALAGAIYAQRNRLPLWSTLDALSPGLCVYMVFYHLANFASGSAFGTPTTMPFAIQLWGETRHAVQLYEAAGAVLISAAIIAAKPHKQIPGTTFWTFLALTALARLFFEFFRADAATTIGNIHHAQVVAWCILAISLYQLGRRRPKAAVPTETDSVKGQS